MGLFQSTAGNGCNVEFLEVKTLVKEAFGTPFDIRNMIRAVYSDQGQWGVLVV